jgi:hypothetical protein
MKYYQGRYTPIHPEKYQGEIGNICYRSSWEKRVMLWLDQHPSVLWWGSESFPIPYMSPVDKRPHRYFPDFVVHMRKKDTSEQTFIWEIKPHRETMLRPAPQRSSRRFLQEAATYSINRAKWDACDAFCLAKGWTFMVITEKNIPGLKT